MLRAKLSHVGTATLPRLCARMTQLVIPHLPPELSADERMVDAVQGIDAVASGELAGPDPELSHLVDDLGDYIEERQDDFAAAACLPVGEALYDTLRVTQAPTIDGAAGALLAIAIAVEMKVFMSSGHGDDRVMVTSSHEHSEFMEKVRHGPAVTGFAKILDREVARVATVE